MTVEEYRKKHRRCRHCEYVRQRMFAWDCCAKGKSRAGRVGDTLIAGMLCKIYMPKEGIK